MDVQGVMLDLIEHTSFNRLDGKRVRADLDKFRNLWQSALITSPLIGIVLRDLPSGIYNVDTIYVLAAPGRRKELDRLVRKWNASEIEWFEGKAAQEMLGKYGPDYEPEVVQIWWD